MRSNTDDEFTFRYWNNAFGSQWYERYNHRCDCGSSLPLPPIAPYSISVATDLVILLDARRRHSVNDWVTARIHVADGIADGDQREHKHNAEPQNDVENDRVIFIVALGQVQIGCLFE